MTFRTVTCAFTMATVVLSVGSAPAQSFTPTTTPMASPRILHTATLLLDGKVLVTGGDNVLTAETFDPLTGTFSLTGSPAVPRSFHTATLLWDGRVLITGGRPAFGGGAIQSAEIFDPDFGGTFSPTGSMEVVRSKHTATLLLDGRVLITGGNSSTAEIFDPDFGGTFSSTGSMGVVRNRHTATLLADGTVLVAGGEGPGPAFGLLDTAEIFDPAGNGGIGSFSLTNGEMTKPRGADHTATLLSDNTVLLVGGRQPDPPFTIRTADLYNPIAKTFIEANGLMPGARNFHTATLLNDDTVLIAGGQIAGQINTFRAAIYEFTTEVFSETAHMATQRDFHKSTLLLDGKVLITGGFGLFTGGGTPTLSSAEVFEVTP